MFAFFLSFLFSTAPSYLYVTQWTLSARGLFVTLIPLFVFLNLFMFSKKVKINKILFLNILFIVLLFSIHRMAFFMIATIFPTVFLIYVIYSNRFLAINRHLASLNKRYRMIIIIVSIIIFVYLLMSFYTQEPMLKKINQSLSNGKIFSGDSAYIKIANIGLSFLASGGILVVFVLIPLIQIIKTKKAGYKQAYFLFILLLLMLIIFYPAYFRPYSALFLSFFIAAYLGKSYLEKSLTIRNIHINLRKSIPILLAISLLFSIGLQAKWDGNIGSTSKQWMDYEQEGVVGAIKNIPSDNVFVSTGEVSRYSALYSEKMSMPPGGYSYDYYYYIFSKCSYMLSLTDLNMTLSPSVDWSGEIYLYKEHPVINESLYDIYNLSFYELLESKLGKIDSARISNMNVTDRMYLIYASDGYGIYLVDSTDKCVQKTQLYFYRP
jgi:hypothetical protein